MRKPNDLANKKFGRLTAIKIVDVPKNGAYWLCHCSCGKNTVVRNDKLLKGITQSCGCLRKEKITKRNLQQAWGLSRTPIYKRYRTMLQRCYYKNNSFVKKHYYQERNITVCDEWLGKNGFKNFYNWAIEHNFKKELTLDRIDNDKGYSPDNCRWATYKEQRHNQRKIREKGVWTKLNNLDKEKKQLDLFGEEGNESDE